MGKLFIVNIFIFFFLAPRTLAQQGFRISGFVKDLSTGEALIGANIVEQSSGKGCISDYHGFFSMILNSTSVCEISYNGYTTDTLTFVPGKDSLITILLTSGNELNEIVVKAQRKQQFNLSSLNSKELLQIPSIGGKPDVSKSLQLLPGISSQNEGSSVLLVRGGDPGQNLYLFDNIPILYVHHLGGFSSVFNPDIINHIDVFKGGFPARYGGKISSVVDITQKEGDISGLKGSIGIGVTDLSFAMEGPTKIKNSSFMLTGRKTLTDALMAMATGISEENMSIVSYGFHDINGKFTWKPNQSNTLHITIYQGDDYFSTWLKSSESKNGEKNHYSNSWGNIMTSVIWKHALSNGLFATNSLSYVRYRLKEKRNYTLPDDENSMIDINSKYIASIQDISLRSDLRYYFMKNWSINTGLQASYVLNAPNYFEQSNIPGTQEKEVLKNGEIAIYFDNKFSILERIEFKPGIRLVNYLSSAYSFFSIEPRLDLNFEVTANHTLNTSYMQINQFAHLLSTTGEIMNNEIWVTADKQLPTAFSEQYTVGWNGKFYKNKFSAEVNVYTKKMRNLTVFKEGFSSLKGDPDWHSKLESGGVGNVMGVEFLLRKNYGIWTGFASYSFSNATRQFPNINGGEEYIFEYNRPHSVSLCLNYKLNEKLTFNLVWTGQSGLPFTPAIGRQYTPSVRKNDNGEYFYYEALIYGDKNSERMKTYHRLDIGLNYTVTTKKNRTATWNFSLYNAYNRHNPYYYYYNTSSSAEIYRPEFGEELKTVSLYQVSYFPIIPSISYKLFFDRNASNNNKQKKSLKQKFKNWLYYEN